MPKEFEQRFEQGGGAKNSVLLLSDAPIDSLDLSSTENSAETGVEGESGYDIGVG